jgi:hypothetical protein
MADLKMALVDARDRIEEKDKEIARLKKAFEFKGKTIEAHDMLYEERDGHPIGLPFCPRCVIKLTKLSKEADPVNARNAKRCTTASPNI